MSKLASDEKTKVSKGGEIATSNRMFIAIKEIGMADAKDKTVLSMGYKGKWFAEPDRPFSTLLCPLIEEVLTLASFSSREALLEDFGQFLRYAESLKKRTQPTAEEGDSPCSPDASSATCLPDSPAAGPPGPRPRPGTRGGRRSERR